VVRDRIRSSIVFVRIMTLSAPLWAVACAPKAAQEKPPPEKDFAVSDYYAPSGAMGDGATMGNFRVGSSNECKERPAGARGNCFNFHYDASNPYTTPITKSTGVCNWAGLFFQYPANNWGTAPGLLVQSGKLTKVTFQVAVGAGMELMTFQMGGVGSPPLPDGGPPPPPSGACPPAETPPPPNYDVLIGMTMQQVGTEWQKIEIPLATRDPSVPVPAATNLIGALAWSLAATPGLPKTIFLDDLYVE
jgi:hypothetical protein